MIGRINILQINLNRSGHAQDLTSQYVIDRRIGVVCVTEPRRILTRNPHWCYSENDMAAIYRSPTYCTEPGIVTCVNRDFVAVKFRNFYIISIYISPNSGTKYFLESIHLRSYCLKCDRPYIICGDLNARSRFWGDLRENPRGKTLKGWMSGLDLRVCNSGNIPTCVRPQGTSIVDLTIVSAVLVSRIHEWHVVIGDDSSSDHRYIFFHIQWSVPHANRSFNHARYPRWSLKCFDKSLFNSLLEFKGEFFDKDLSVEELSDWLSDTMKSACDLAAKRVFPHTGGRAVYWWCEEVAARRRSFAALRRVNRIVQRRFRSLDDDGTRVAEILQEYRSARQLLRREIRRAKIASWNGLIADLDKDPWGLPYKLVLNKLRHSTPCLTETLCVEDVNKLITTLFPVGQTHDPVFLWWNIRVPQGKCSVTIDEVKMAMRASRGSGNPAPGPDGITIGIWRSVSPLFLERLVDIFSACFRDEVFPRKWKRAKLVLIPKDVATRPNALPKVRPICLLDDIGKVLERILVSRIKSIMERKPGARLSDHQFGFREGRSTLDALDFALSTIRRSIFKGRGGGVRDRRQFRYKERVQLPPLAGH